MDIKEIIDSRLYEEAFAVEKVYFTKTDRKVNPKKVEPFKYWKGTLPVLVAASHAVRHIRKKKIKPSDLFTGSIAYLLGDLTNCHVLALTKLYGGDPNYDSPCIFKERIKKICKENKINFIIDLHGAGKDKKFDIDIGNMNGKSLLKQKNVLNKLEKSLKKSGIKNISYNYFPAEKQNTVIKYSSQQLNIPALQLEINRKFRAPNQNGEAYNKVLAALSSFIMSI